MRRRLKWHRGAFVLCMWLATGAIGRPVAANAQTTSSTPPSSGARATSPFMMEPSGAPGIPLGATGKMQKNLLREAYRDHLLATA